MALPLDSDVDLSSARILWPVYVPFSKFPPNLWPGNTVIPLSRDNPKVCFRATCWKKVGGGGVDMRRQSYPRKLLSPPRGESAELCLGPENSFKTLISCALFREYWKCGKWPGEDISQSKGIPGTYPWLLQYRESGDFMYHLLLTHLGNVPPTVRVLQLPCSPVG